MPFGVKQDGQEDLLTNDYSTLTLTFSLYNESANLHPFDGGLAEITTEPTGMTRVDESVTIKLVDGQWQFSTNSEIKFDVIDQTEQVDGYFALNATDDTFILTSELLDPNGNPRTVNLSEVDELSIDPGAGGTFVQV